MMMMAFCYLSDFLKPTPCSAPALALASSPASSHQFRLQLVFKQLHELPNQQLPLGLPSGQHMLPFCLFLTAASSCSVFLSFPLLSLHLSVQLFLFVSFYLTCSYRLLSPAATAQPATDMDMLSTAITAGPQALPVPLPLPLPLLHAIQRPHCTSILRVYGCHVGINEWVFVGDTSYINLYQRRVNPIIVV